jgi:hypothetical protein
MRFEADELRTAIAAMPCPDCGHIGGHAQLELEGLHFARIVCPTCRRFLDWLGWPPKPEKRERRRTARLADELKRLGLDHCELCLRSEADLPPPDALRVHHVDEEATNDDPANQRLYCTGCHQLVHWLRTYFGHYIAV